MERLLLIGLEPAEFDALRGRLHVPLVSSETLPRVKVERGVLLVERPTAAGQFLPVSHVVFHGIFEHDFDAITAKLIDMAKAGDLGAIRKGLDRLFGKPRQERTKHIDRAIRTIAEGERTNLDRKRQRRRRYQLSAGGTGVT